MVAASLSRTAGGILDSLVGMCRELRRFPGVEVEALGLNEKSNGGDHANWSPVSVRTFPVAGPRSFGYAPSLKLALIEGDFTLLHTHGLWMYPSAAVSDWHTSTARPYLISPHGMLDEWAVRNSAWKKRLALAFYERRHLEKAACIRALCESEAQSIRAFGLKNPICIIPNGIDLPGKGPRDDGTTGPRDYRTTGLRDYGTTRPRDYGGLEHRKVLLYLGRIHPKKGLVNLLGAWSAVQKSGVRGPGSEWILAIAGWDQGGHEAELKQLATEMGTVWRDVRQHRTLNIEHRTSNAAGQGEVSNAGSQLSTLNPQRTASVVFLGPQFGADNEAAYRNCDAFILPSLSEGLPMVVLEAWAHGKPVLMTPECNLPEGFAAGAAIRIELGDGIDQRKERSIAAGLRTLFQFSDSDLQSAGARGRALVAEKFTWPKIAQDMRDVYEWVLGGGQKPPCVDG